MILPAGQWVGLLGPSGIGKSSLLKEIAGLNQGEHNNSEKIQADNQIPVSQQVAYMGQTDLLLPWFNALENAILGMKLRSNQKKEAKQKAARLFTAAGLQEAMYLYPKQLSGGMRQRVALIRTLMEDKPIVLMDEPFSALDTITRFKLHELAIQFLKNKTILFITHDPQEALRLAHVIYIMKRQPPYVKLFPLTNMGSSSQLPRTLDHPDVIKYQSLLLNELLHSTEE